MERGYGLEPNSTVRVLKESPGEATCEGIASVTVKAPAYWRYQDPGITTKDSNRWHDAGPRLQVSCVSCRWQRLRSGDAQGLLSLEGD